MKRLMTMLAAAGTALGLYAAPYGNGSTFEVGDGATVGATTIAALNALTETTGGYWATNGVPDTLRLTHDRLRRYKRIHAVEKGFCSDSEFVLSHDLPPLNSSCIF